MKDQLPSIVPSPQLTRYANVRELSVAGSFTASSGFTYMVGERECEFFKVQEAIAVGTGIEYLCSLKVFIKDELIVDESYQDLKYTRNTVRNLLSSRLITYFAEAMKRQGTGIDTRQVQAKIDQLLDQQYYGKSDQAALGLLKEWNLL